MAKGKTVGKLFQFPLPLDGALEVEGPRDPVDAVTTYRNSLETQPLLTDVVISGTFRKDNDGLKRAYEELRDLGCRVLSPTSVHVVSELDGFVFMEGEQTQLPENIELRHLHAIQEAQFMWLHAPDGYVGLSAALEVGFAHAIGVPVYSTNQPSDPILSTFVRLVESPVRLLTELLPTETPHVPHPAVHAFQKYYKRAAVERGYGKESARDTLLLMVEEVGELARAIRKRENLKRHGSPIREDVELELADVFIYVVHLANVLGVSLSEVVVRKELLNIGKVLSRAITK